MPVLHVDADIAVEIVARSAACAVRSLVAFEITYGLISRFLAPGGTSRPTSVAMSDDCEVAAQRHRGGNAA